MASEALIAWQAPAHPYVEKKPDWYWAVGIVTLALAVTAFLFGEFITGIFVIAAALALVLHASRPPHTVSYEINDRGLASDDVLYPFVTLDSFWIPHNESPSKIILKSRKLFMPLIVIYMEDIDPEDVREVLLRYIAETEHHEPILKRFLEWLGF
jgi:hypothetical protein